LPIRGEIEIDEELRRRNVQRIFTMAIVEIVARVCVAGSQSTGASLRFIAASLETWMNPVSGYSPAAIMLMVWL
jgi:hypothetical protein